MSRWWPRQSLGQRLALWYAATVLATLAVLAPVVYVLIEHRLHAVFDRQLRVDLDLIEATLDIGPGGEVSWRGSGSSPEDYTGSRFAWFEVWSSDGRLLFRGHPGNRDAGDATLGPPLPGVVRSSSALLGDGLEVRVLEHPASRVDGDLMLRGYRDEAGLHRTLRQILVAFLLGAPLAALLAALGGYAMARRALAPVAAMADQAGRIHSESLATRFPNPHPDDELGQLTTAFNDTLGRLERSFTAMHRFTGDASHELRTPLTALRTVGEVGLREAEGEAALRQVVSSMLEEGGKLEDVLESLLVLARGDSGGARLEPEDLDARALLAEARERLDVLAAERGQVIVLEDGEPATVKADHDLTMLALTNLLHNAIRYSPAGGEIVLRSARRDGWTALEVSDRGPGIEPALHEKVFERFFRVDAARSREPGGSGLGLAIARLFVEQQGGRVELDSEPGRGSTFRLLLPVVD